MKKLLLGLLMAMSVGAASAEDTSYMYWMISETGSTGWEYAKLAVQDNSTGKVVSYLCWAENADVTAFDNAAVDTSAGGYLSATLMAVGSTYLSDSYSFVAELYNSEDKAIMFTSTILGGSIMASSDKELVSGVNNFSGAVIPEPTSGLLAMLGFGLLALRRKQKNA